MERKRINNPHGYSVPVEGERPGSGGGVVMDNLESAAFAFVKASEAASRAVKERAEVERKIEANSFIHVFGQVFSLRSEPGKLLAVALLNVREEEERAAAALLDNARAALSKATPSQGREGE